jgi:hypothetical protein
MLMPPETMRQEAPFPTVLADLLKRFDYSPPGRTWNYWLSDKDRGQGSSGLTLIIGITGPDTFHPEKTISVNHYMLVPPAAFDERSWTHWLFDQVTQVELHERMEFFKVDGRPAYPPSHGPGSDPYLLREYGTDLDRRTKFDGTVNPV